MESVAIDTKKALCIMQLTKDLPVLRARIRLSQEEVANRIGVTRQTYNAIESQRRPMTWNTCVSLVTLFSSHEETKRMMRSNNYCYEVMEEIMCGR